MAIPSNVIPLVRDQVQAEPEDPNAATILGRLCREDFELWVCRSAGGTLSLKWWRWSEDDEHFDPLQDGALTLDATELQPLAELLQSVANLLEIKKL
ncbi:MAG: hypothetical protein P4L36_15975 [Holophaga sp.]|nr:hypothetical protein [Holophaga sp.]